MTNNNNDSTQNLTGLERLKADLRQFGALIFAFGITATFGALADIATQVGPNSTTASSGIPLSTLVAACAQAFFGSVAMFTGYQRLVADKGSKFLTAFLIVVTQLAFLPFLTTLTNVGQGARKDPQVNPFIPTSYSPSATDVRFVGAMGLVAVMCYGTAYIGSLAFMEFSLFAYQTGSVSDRSAKYYRGRLTFYSSLMSLAGLTQLLLGCYILSRFGNGPLPHGPIGVALYTVHFPEISVFVGIVQLMVGLWGIARRFGLLVGGPRKDDAYQACCFLTWLCMLSLQLMVQVAYAPGGMLAAAAPTRANIMLGLAFMPAFLDSKARNTPEKLSGEYYGLGVSVAGDVEKEERRNVDESV